jgi:hypothetical protein
MKNIFYIIIFLSIAVNGYCQVSAADGQDFFDMIFWGAMGFFCIGLTFSMAVKSLNRS